ncbi:hypothetical protein BM527_15045 [Alteromonas sp. Mex14]|nr:hypothetical protein BM527_15045 [Alteromonas sp. Mex14]
MSEIKIPKKLIEVALPLDDINAACSKEKQPFTKKHPRSLHLWWARRPQAAARAVLFAQLVNDPSEMVNGDKRLRETKLRIQREREDLFNIIRDLVLWENTNNESVLDRARNAIKKSWRFTCELNKNHPSAKTLFDPEKLPEFHDPFAGGGAIPLEAQRLGLVSYASDLNPVSVMINKSMIEIPHKFSSREPIGPLIENIKQSDLVSEWSGLSGLAEDIRRYGYWIQNEAFKRVGHLYPKIKIDSGTVKDREDLKGYLGQEIQVVAYIWARTVKSPNPIYNNVDVPLVRSFILSSKKGKEAWVEPVINGSSYEFVVHDGKKPSDKLDGTVVRTGGTCLMSGSPIPFKYIREEGKARRIGVKLMAIVAEGKKGRIYLSPSKEMSDIAHSAEPDWRPEHKIPVNPRDFKTPNYGMDSFGDLFTNRQLISIDTIASLVKNVKSKVKEDAKRLGLDDDQISLHKGGEGVSAYGEAIATYLALATSRWTDMCNAMASWNSTNQNVRALFARQAIPMNWDFVELTPFSKVGPWISCVESIFGLFNNLSEQSPGYAIQADAASQKISADKVISTDPPYYDNIGYADLSDFFYVWLRRSLKEIYPDLFSTLAVPKAEELVATPYRHGSKEAAEDFFLKGMTTVITNIANHSHPAFPVSIYYAFKQSETSENSTSSTGWETFLEAVIRSGFSIDGTWPMRTEREARAIGIGSNALASSIVLVCNRRPDNAETISRRQFQRELRENMPFALEAMIGGDIGVSPIAPVDLAQSAIGPGMAIFSKYDAILESDGSKMSVHDALILINRAITEFLNPDSGSFDSDTLFCDDWFSQYGWSAGSFGEADTLARAKGTSVDGVRDAGVIESGAGKVRLLKWSEYPTNWDPKTDNRTPVWEACHQMIRVLNQQGEADAGALLARMPEQGEHIRQLAYHLYTLCERKKWAEEARAYNELIGSWHAIVAASQEAGERGSQSELGFDF